MATSIVQSGNNSATFSVDPFGGPVTWDYDILGKNQWEMLPKGRLRDILFRDYGPVNTPAEVAAATAAFFAAFYGAGGQVQASARTTDNSVLDAPTVWTVSDIAGTAGYPVLNIEVDFGLAYPSSGQPSFFRISLAYSASE